MKRVISILLAGFLSIGCSVAEEEGAETTAADNNAVETIRKALKRIAPTMDPDSITPSELSGFHEVLYGTDVVYVSDDGRYLLQGSIFDMTTDTNLTEVKRADGRRHILDRIDDADTIIFAANEAKHRVTIFTDIDCTYCRKLHREMKDYNDLGISVRYVFSPRSQRSQAKAVSVWCADDRLEAMTISKAGEALPEKECDNPVQEHAKISGEIGVSGTPMIVLDSGVVVSGYVPATRLMQVLESQ